MPSPDADAPPSPPPAPRSVPSGAVRWSARFLLLFGGIWGLVGTTIALVFTLVGGPVWNDWILDSRGVHADASPFDVHVTNSRVNSRYVHQIQFRFTDPAGQEHTGRAGTTDPALIAIARKGTPVPIEYDPQDPERVRLAGGSASFFGAFTLIPLGFAAVGGVLFLLGFMSARQTRALYRDGTAVTARVVAVEATRSSQNYQRVARMVYELAGPTGTVRGEWKTTTPVAHGSTIWVIYDPGQPERSVPANV